MNGKEFKKALDNIVKEKDIDPEVVYSAMELALTSAYKKNFNSKTNVKVLFVIGVNDGVFPMPFSSEGFITDNERDLLLDNGAVIYKE